MLRSGILFAAWLALPATWLTAVPMARAQSPSLPTVILGPEQADAVQGKALEDGPDEGVPLAPPRKDTPATRDALRRAQRDADARARRLADSQKGRGQAAPQPALAAPGGRFDTKFDGGAKAMPDAGAGIRPDPANPTQPLPASAQPSSNASRRNTDMGPALSNPDIARPSGRDVDKAGAIEDRMLRQMKSPAPKAY